MKYLLLLLIIPSIVFANFRVNIVKENGEGLYNDFKTEVEANDYIAKFKNKWGRDAGWLRSDCGNSTATRVVQDLGEDVTEYMCPATYSTNIVDITTEATFKKLEGMAAANMNCGKSVKAFIGALNVTKGLTQEQIKTIMSTYAEINSLLDGGALDTAITEINALVADGTLITGADKTQIILKIQGCKVTWQ